MMKKKSDQNLDINDLVSSISPELKRELWELVKENKPVQAVARLREETGLDLLRAKQLMDKLSHNW